jgi:hypothetical protein
VLFVSGCKNKDNTPLIFYTLLENTRLRDAPGTEGKEIMQLAKDTPLTDMGEVSSFSTAITLQGVAYNEPWLKVRAPDGRLGWIFAGAVRFDTNNQNETTKLLINKRLQSFFGKKLTLNIQHYQENYANTNTDAAFANTYAQGAQLRDTIATIFASKVLIDNQRNLPDLFWMNAALPGYIPQLAAEGTSYWLFADYHTWLAKAQQTEGKQDNDFVKVCLAVYASDSIEFFFPSWKIQTTDYEASSELGKGIHSRIFDQIELTLKNSPLFKPQLLVFKDKLIDDITNKNITYWQDKNLIIKELDVILEKKYSFLNESEKIALRTRRQQFETPVENEIRVNVRSGE